MRNLAVLVTAVFAVTARGDNSARSFTFPNTGFVSSITEDRGSVFIVHERLNGPCIARLSSDASATVSEECYGPANEINGGRVAGSGDGFFVYGSSHPGQRDLEAAFVFRIGASGNLVWSRRYAAPVAMRITAGAATADGGLVMVGSIGRIAEGLAFADGEKALVMKIDRSGKLEWHRVFDTSGIDELKDVRVTGDGVVTAGWSEAGALVAKLRLDGRVQWTTFVPDAFPNAVQSMPGGDVVAAGMSGSNAVLWIARFDAGGRVLWQRDSDVAQSAISQLRLLPSGDVAAYAITAGTQTLLTLKNNGVVASAVTFPAPRSLRTSTLTDRGALLLTGGAGTTDVLPIAFNGDGSSCMPRGTPAQIALQPRTSARVDYPVETGQQTIVEKAQPAQRSSVAVANRESCGEHVAEAAQTGPTKAEAAVRQEESAFDTEVRDLLTTRKFDELDRRAAEYRSSRAVFSNGQLKAFEFYGVLSDARSFGSEQQHLALLREWRKRNPKSPAAAIALTRAYMSYFWLMRGGSVASTITDTASKKIAELQQQAVTTLGEAASIASGDPEYDVTRAEVFGPQCKIQDIAYDPDAAQRKYQRFFRAAAYYLMPRWCGSTEEYRKYAEYATAALGEGDWLYARLAYDALFIETNAPMGNPPMSVFGEYRFDWVRMKRGLEDLIRRYPSLPIYRHMLAFSAWKAGDRQTAREAFQHPDVVWNGTAAEVWINELTFGRARDWALEPPPAQGFVASNEPKLKAPAEAPSGWIASAGKEWPPIVLRNTLKLRDGTEFKDFNSFLVETPAGVVAISSTRQLDVQRETHIEPYRVGKLRTMMASWTMVSPSSPSNKLTVNSIERGDVAFDRGIAVTVVAGSGSKLPVQVLKLRTSPIDHQSPVFIVGCLPAGAASCKQTIYSGRLHGRINGGGPAGYGSLAITLDDDVDWRDFTGSPVVDADGLAVGVLSNESFGGSLKRNEAMVEEIPLLTQ